MAAPLLDDVVVLVDPASDSLAVLGDDWGGGVPVLERLLRLDLNTNKISLREDLCHFKEKKPKLELNYY